MEIIKDEYKEVVCRVVKFPDGRVVERIIDLETGEVLAEKVLTV